MGNFDYTGSSRDLFQRYSLVDILSMYGKYDGGVHHSRLYPNPWNPGEKTPSFEISRMDDGTEVWHCFGEVPDEVRRRLRMIKGQTGRNENSFVGGGLLDLVALLGNMDSREEAFRHLSSESGLKFATRGLDGRQDDQHRFRPSSIVVEQARPDIRRSELVSYSRDRRALNPALVSQYCEQVRLHFSKNPKNAYYYISFANDKGGRALRNADPKIGKIATSPGAPTSIDCEGRRTTKRSSERVVVFEGFFNFLSYLDYFGKSVPGSYDVCVLNSVSNLSQALPRLCKYSTVALALDNDKAGYAAVKRITEECEGKGVRVRNLAKEVYPSFNDMNDFLISSRSPKRGRGAGSPGM